MLSVQGLIQACTSAELKHFLKCLQGALTHLVSVDPVEILPLPLIILTKLGLVMEITAQCPVILMYEKNFPA